MKPIIQPIGSVSTMGNYLSCTIPTLAGGGGGPRATMVIFPAGVTRKFESTVNAADLMLDVPNHFVVNAAAMEIGHRVSPLAADEELEMGGLYVMLPMKRINSTVSAGDMGLLLMVSTKRKKMVVAKEEEEEDKASVGASATLSLDQYLEEIRELELRNRMKNRCRSRKPTLETIVEENSMISSR